MSQILAYLVYLYSYGCASQICFQIKISIVLDM